MIELFTVNGEERIAYLSPNTISCKVTEELNGIFELEMEYSPVGDWYNDIQLRRLIRCKPNPFEEPELFRIDSISRNMHGNVVINASHISYDLKGILVSPWHPELDGAFIGQVNHLLNWIKDNHMSELPVNYLLEPEYIDKTQPRQPLAGPMELQPGSDILNNEVTPTVGRIRFKAKGKKEKAVNKYTKREGFDFSNDEKNISIIFEEPKTVMELLYQINQEKNFVEFEFRGLNCFIHRTGTRGQNRGLVVKREVNMSEFSQQEDIDGVYNRVYAYWRGDITVIEPSESDPGKTEEKQQRVYVGTDEGKTVSLTPKGYLIGRDDNSKYSITLDKNGRESTSSKTVEQKLAFDKKHIYENTLALNCTSYIEHKKEDWPKAEDWIAYLKVRLPEFARWYLKQFNLDNPNISIKVSYLDIAGLDHTEREQFNLVHIGDTVTVEYPLLNVSYSTRCMKTVYDAVRDRYDSLEIGNSRQKTLDNVLVK